MIDEIINGLAANPDALTLLCIIYTVAVVAFARRLFRFTDDNEE